MGQGTVGVSRFFFIQFDYRYTLMHNIYVSETFIIKWIPLYVYLRCTLTSAIYSLHIFL